MFRISDTIRSTQTADGGILLDVDHGQMFCLNVVGAKILEFMQKGYDEFRIAEEISREFVVDQDLAYRDVLEFIDALHKNCILESVTALSIAPPTPEFG